MLMFILIMLVVGFIAGLIARAIVPGNDSMSLLATAILGIVGSFVGGFLGYVLTNKDVTDGALQPAGIVGSIIGAVIALIVYRAANGRSINR